MAQGLTMQEEEEDLFFDSRDSVSTAYDSCPNSPERCGSSPEDQLNSLPFSDTGSEFWMKDPVSVKERRSKLMRIFEVDIMSNPNEKPKACVESHLDIDRATSDCSAVLRCSCSGNGNLICCSSRVDAGSSCNEESESFQCRIENLDDGTVFMANELDKDGILKSLREVGSDRIFTVREFERNFGSSSLILRLMRRQDEASSISEKSVTRKNIGWPRKLRAIARIFKRRREDTSSTFSASSSIRRPRTGWIKVNTFKKQLKELSAFYNMQEFKAHNGSILAMKFSPDGRYLATGGEDGVVRVWSALEVVRTGEISIPGDNPSCIYFTMNHNSELTPLCMDICKKVKSKRARISSDSMCVIFPPSAFQLSEKPLHEFLGHGGHVLDLSWSNNKCLLSSSLDRTVRMWQIGLHNCVKVFPHNNYVTCVQFNPINEDYFVSGSIDGKVRIWEISQCHVVDWADVREIISAVCYQTDGKGVVVGTLRGICRFYDASDNHLQLDAEVSLQGKKKPMKSITGFQFCPRDPRKLLVSSADSQIRILDGTHVVAIFKGIRNSGSRISASFTADGQHIISASEDSSVCMWSHASHVAPTFRHLKSTCSRECFLSSSTTTIAIPWCGLQSGTRTSQTSEAHCLQNDVFRENASVPGCDSNCHIEDLFGNKILSLSPSFCFSLSREFLEFLPKSSATWPEEKLPSNSDASTFCKSRYMFLKTSLQNTSHAWGQVIVTAGLDGCIRSYQNYGFPQHL